MRFLVFKELLGLVTKKYFLIRLIEMGTHEKINIEF
jgi:hypothetical protein